MKYLLLLVVLVGCGGSEKERQENGDFSVKLEHQIKNLEYKENKLILAE